MKKGFVVKGKPDEIVEKLEIMEEYHNMEEFKDYPIEVISKTAEIAYELYKIYDSYIGHKNTKNVRNKLSANIKGVLEIHGV